MNVLRKKNKFHWANEVRLAVRKKKEFYAERVTCLLALFLHTHTQAYRVYEEEDKGKKKKRCHQLPYLLMKADLTRVYRILIVS